MNLLNIKKQMNEIANFKKQKTNFQYLIFNIQSLKIEFCCLEFIWDLFFLIGILIPTSCPLLIGILDEYKVYD